MNENIVSTVLAGITGGIGALLGVPYLVVVWAFIGAIGALVFTPPESKSSAALTVLLSALIGAGLGNAAAQFIGGGNASLIAAGLLFGAGAKPILSSAVAALQARIKKAGDQ